MGRGGGEFGGRRRGRSRTASKHTHGPLYTQMLLGSVPVPVPIIVKKGII